ncbi:MAG: DUF3592 domain-containing protein [Patescibacteria group bacterium]|nr:DUF3592 domain-containing protein [Patescibacteria group bacterium]
MPNYQNKPTPLWLAIIFALIGLTMAGFGAKMAVDTRQFLAVASRTTGEVVDVEESQSDDSTTYHPVVEYSRPDGQMKRFRSSTGSNPPSHSIGDQVTVLYDVVSDREDIDAFSDLWLGPIILGGMGLLFALVGLALLPRALRESRYRRWLRANGRRLTTIVAGVEPIGSAPADMTGRWRRLKQYQRGWRLVTAWTDETGAKRTFASPPLQFDPTPKVQIGATPVEVIVDPGNFGQYEMNLKTLKLR